jgi:hypothetical protein
MTVTVHRPRCFNDSRHGEGICVSAPGTIPGARWVWLCSTCLYELEHPTAANAERRKPSSMKPRTPQIECLFDAGQYAKRPEA